MCVRGWNLFPLSIIEKDSPFLVALVVKNLPANAGDIIDLGSIPGWGRSLGGGHGNPLQYSCQENPMDRGTWRGAYNPWNQKELDDWSDLACMHTQLESRYTFKYINKSFKKKNQPEDVPEQFSLAISPGGAVSWSHSQHEQGWAPRGNYDLFHLSLWSNFLWSHMTISYRLLLRRDLQRLHGAPVLYKGRHIKIKNSTFVNIFMKGIMLSEISQTEKNKYYMMSLICGI